MIKFVSGFAPQIIEFLNYRVEMGIDVRSNEAVLSLFDRYCYEHYPNEENLTKEIVRGWISDEIEKGRTGLPNKVSGMRMFARYLANGSYMVPTNLAHRGPRFTPYILTDEELSSFFEAVDNLEHKTDFFIRESISVLLRLIYTCGLRPHEGRLLKRRNIDFETGEILIEKAKRRKQRIVVMAADMMQLCKQYDTKRNIVAGESEYFFVNGKGKEFSLDFLWIWFNKCWAAANPGISKDKLPHLRIYDLRHRFASAIMQKWIDEGRNLYAMLPYLRTHMGHERFADTAYYIHILPENLLCSPGVNWDAIDADVPGVNVWIR